MDFRKKNTTDSKMKIFKNWTDKMSKIIDEEITILVKKAEENAKRILKKYLNNLHLLAEALLEYESISGIEMDDIINGRPIIRNIKKSPTKQRKRRNKRAVSKRDIKKDSNIITKPAT